MRRLTAAVLALAFSGVLAATPAPVAADHGAERSTAKVKPHAKYQRKALSTTNEQRSAAGVPALRRTDCLQRVAVRQAKAMAQQERTFHQDLGTVMTECGLLAAGENVAEGYRTGRSVVVAGWMTSPPHRVNLLNPLYRVVGIGARKGHDGRWYVAQVLGMSL